MVGENRIVVNADGAILGRLSAFAAKQALLGKNVVIVNCNNCLVSGRKGNTIKEYNIKRQRGGSSRKGPNFPNLPERLVKRTIRGMLSYQQGRGKDALKRIICYNETPAEFESVEKIDRKQKVNTKTMTLKELGREM